MYFKDHGYLPYFRKPAFHSIAIPNVCKSNLILQEYLERRFDKMGQFDD